VEWGWAAFTTSSTRWPPSPPPSTWAWRPPWPREALGRFENVKRRMEVRARVVNGIGRVYDDFAHHPTAIRTTINGLRRRIGSARILAVFEPRSNTMKLGAMKSQLPWSLEEADLAFCHSGGLDWDAAEALTKHGCTRPGGQHRGRAGRAGAGTGAPGDHILSA
jgi:UDP-N-acetylmuramate: L-alanyl-gamma-D-glutamyl-meso-diaminopimelate ligase